jgi:hypothetical protein
MSAGGFLDNKGRLLLNFHYQGEVDLSIPYKFRAHNQTNEKILRNSVFRGFWMMLCLYRTARSFHWLFQGSIRMSLIFWHFYHNWPNFSKIISVVYLPKQSLITFLWFKTFGWTHGLWLFTKARFLTTFRIDSS